MLNNIIYPTLSYQLTGICFQTHNQLGHFAKEKQYSDLLERLLKENQIEYKREVIVPFQVGENKIDGNVADFIVADKIIIECKAKKFITKDDYYQMQRYLMATNLKLGLIVNFHSIYLKPKRVINYSQR